MKKKIAWALVGVAIGATGFLFASAQIALAVFNSTGGTTYNLKASISSSQTSITLTSFTEPVSGTPYTMSYINTSVAYGTINPEAANSEFVSFTGITQNANGSATLTGVVRGLARTPGTGGCVASTTLAQPFPGQTRFILSSPPCFFSQYPAKANDETISGQWTFTTFPITPASPQASETTAGISQLATGAQAAASTLTGSSASRLALPTKISTSTWNFGSAGNVIPVTDLSTKQVSSLFISTSSLFAYTFPAAKAVSSSTVLMSDASGSLTWNAVSSLSTASSTVTVQSPSTATSTVYSATIPAGVLGKSNAVRITFPGVTAGGINTCSIYIEAAYGTASTSATLTNATGGTAITGGPLTLYVIANGASNAQKISLNYVGLTAGMNATPVGAAFFSNNTAAAIDSTVAQPILIRVNQSTSGCGAFTNIYAPTTEILRQ